MAGMCWVTTIAGASEGNAISSSCSASTPPVEAPTAMIFSDVLYDAPGLRIGCTLVPESVRTSRTAAALTLAVISQRSAGSPSTRPTTGLATKSIAPISNARRAISAPFCVSDDIITTGIGRNAMIFSRNASPSMRGISISSVSTSGLSVLIMSRATNGFGAAPTTSIEGSLASISDRSCRTKAESSTTSTRILLITASKQFDGAGHRLGLNLRLVRSLVAHENLSLGRLQLQQHHPAGGREIVNPARQVPAQMMGRDRQLLRAQIVLDEVRVAVTDIGIPVQHIAAAEHLDFETLTQAAMRKDVVDQALHGDVAVAHAVGHRVPAAAGAARFRQHEMVHAPDARKGIADAGRDAGAEDRHQHLLRLIRYIVIAGENLHRDRVELAVAVATHTARGARLVGARSCERFPGSGHLILR